MGRIWAYIIIYMLVGCTTFDPLDQRGETVNRSATDYANNATLLNIIRAKHQEPLSFIAVTGVSGLASASASLGLPNVAFGPSAVSAPRNYVFGPNSMGRSSSNTAQFSVIDDPASYAGLMAPVNPAVIAYLMRQGFPRPLLFFLLTSELRETSSAGRMKRYVNDPADPSYGSFIGKMASLLFAGLVAQVDATAFPSGKVLPASRLCFDPLAPTPWGSFGPGMRNEAKKHANPSTSTALCAKTNWIESDIAATAPSSGSGGPTSLGVSQDGSIWVMVSPTKLLHVAPDGKPIPVDISQNVPPKPPPLSTPSHLETFAFDDLAGTHYQIFLRSTIGAYYYVGEYLAQPIDNLLPPDDAGSGSMIDIVENQRKECFAEIDYHGTHYCVPQGAGHTKKLMTVLHLLQQLQTAPSNTPTSLTIAPAP